MDLQRLYELGRRGPGGRSGVERTTAPGEAAEFDLDALAALASPEHAPVPVVAQSKMRVDNMQHGRQLRAQVRKVEKAVAANDVLVNAWNETAATTVNTQAPGWKKKTGLGCANATSRDRVARCVRGCISGRRRLALQCHWLIEEAAHPGCAGGVPSCI